MKKFFMAFYGWFIIFFTASLLVHAECDKTLQTIWEVDLDTHIMVSKNRQTHEQVYCDPAKNSYLNARVDLINTEQKIVYTQAFFFQDRVYFEGEKQHGYVDKKNLSLQIKFPKSTLAQTVQTIELRDEKNKLLARGNW